MITIIVVFITLVALGVPIVLAVGAATTFYITFIGDMSVSLLAHRLYSGLNSFVLMAVPFFVLAGMLMEAAGLSQRIIGFTTALIGWIRGSTLYIAVLASTAIAAMSGSGSADAAAVSSALQPELRRRRYNIDFAAAMIAASSTLAQVLPPSLMMIVIAVQNGLSVGALFVAGIVPGLLASGFLLVAAYLHIRKNASVIETTESFSPYRVGRTFISAIPAMGLAVVIVGGILGGIMTPTEASGVAVVYVMLIGFFVYRELRVKELPGLFLKAAAFTASLLLLVGVANVFNWVVADSGELERMAQFVTGNVSSKTVFLIGVNILLMILGMFLEALAIILLLGTILIQIGLQFGVDPHHMAVIIVFNCAVGLITPPFGVTVFVAALVVDRPFLAVVRHIPLPWFALVTALGLLCAFPEVALTLPKYYGFLK